MVSALKHAELAGPHEPFVRCLVENGFQATFNWLTNVLATQSASLRSSNSILALHDEVRSEMRTKIQKVLNQGPNDESEPYVKKHRALDRGDVRSARCAGLGGHARGGPTGEADL